MKHTKGNWELKLNYDNTSGDKIQGRHTIVAGDWNIARIWEDAHGNNQEKILADAHLIASSPDLLEALQVMLWAEENGEYESQKQGKPRLTERLEIARKAIAKATGEDVK